MPALSANGRRMGRKFKASRPGTTVSLGLKVAAETKARIEQAALASGRTQSQEATMRIERSFLIDDMISAGLMRQGLEKDLA